MFLASLALRLLILRAAGRVECYIRARAYSNIETEQRLKHELLT